MSNQYDHCRNCAFWDKWNQNDAKEAKCSKHEQSTYIRAWCGKHIVGDKYDYNDPSVIHSFHIDMFLRSGNPNIDTDIILEAIRTLGYKGPDDFYSLMRDYDENYPKREIAE